MNSRSGMKPDAQRIAENIIRAIRGCNRYAAELPSGTREVVRLDEAVTAAREVARRERSRVGNRK